MNEHHVIFTTGHVLTFEHTSDIACDLVRVSAGRGLVPSSENLANERVALEIGKPLDEAGVKEFFLGLVSEKVLPGFDYTKSEAGEVVLTPINGSGSLRFATGKNFNGIRVCDGEGREISAISAEEFVEDPDLRFGALFGLLVATCA